LLTQGGKDGFCPGDITASLTKKITNETLLFTTKFVERSCLFKQKIENPAENKKVA
jgi:hypothetical protein